MNVRCIERGDVDLLGEGPMWDSRRNRLFWVDIKAHALRWLDLDGEHYGSLSFGEPVCWIIPRAGRDDFVLGLQSGFHLFDLERHVLTPVGSPETDRAGNRLNDAKVDHRGRIWAGTMHSREEHPSGALYRLDHDLRWSRHDDGYGVTNGPTFSADGRELFHTDTAARTVYAFDLAEDGSLANKRIFLRFEDAWGYPDGMTVDAEGSLWIAHWGGGRISRFSPDGRLIRSIELPATNITSMAFAGPALDRLFVTSSGEDLAHERYAGALFEVDPGVCGLPLPAFGG